MRLVQAAICDLLNEKKAMTESPNCLLHGAFVFFFFILYSYDQNMEFNPFYCFELFYGLFDTIKPWCVYTVT